jgi:hypothetical protein
MVTLGILLRLVASDHMMTKQAYRDNQKQLPEATVLL